jgi:hypothetical protein
VPRRVSLPDAGELVRPAETVADVHGAARTPPPGSGRIRHDEKITVYVSRDELLALEQARLILRARHDMAVDRGRIVREAMSAILADFSRNGGDSELVRRLSDHDRQGP